MKRILSIAFLVCLAFIYSCHKEEEQPPDLFIGAVVKNYNWKAQPSTSYFSGTDSLLIVGTTAINNGYQTLSFKLKFRGVGGYTLKDHEAIFTNVGSVETIYKLDTTKTDTVHVTSFDVHTGIAQGKFEMHFVKASGDAAADNNVSFTNGSFWIPTLPVQ